MMMMPGWFNLVPYENDELKKVQIVLVIFVRKTEQNILIFSNSVSFQSSLLSKAETTSSMSTMTVCPSRSLLAVHSLIISPVSAILTTNW